MCCQRPLTPSLPLVSRTVNKDKNKEKKTKEVEERSKQNIRVNISFTTLLIFSLTSSPLLLTSPHLFPSLPLTSSSPFSLLPLTSLPLISPHLFPSSQNKENTRDQHQFQFILFIFNVSKRNVIENHQYFFF